MKKIAVLFLFACFVLNCSAALDAVAPSSDTNLLFIGTVTSITLDPLQNSVAHWVIVFRVDEVKKGAYAEKTFSFRVHSPSMSGLVVGKVYTVEADRSATGYVAKRWRTHPDDGE